MALKSKRGLTKKEEETVKKFNHLVASSEADSGDPQYEENLIEYPPGSGDLFEVDELRKLLKIKGLKKY
jgi:hypothetical protein